MLPCCRRMFTTFDDNISSWVRDIRTERTWQWPSRVSPLSRVAWWNGNSDQSISLSPFTSLLSTNAGTIPKSGNASEIARSTNHIAGKSPQVSSFHHQRQPPPCTLIAICMHTTWQGYTWNSDFGGRTDKMAIESLIFGETHRRPCRFNYHTSLCSSVTR